MTTRNAIFSAIHFLLIVATLSASGFLIALGMLHHVRFALIQSLTDNPKLFLLLGAIGIGIAALFLYAFYFLSRVYYFQLRMGVEIDPRLVTQLVQGCVKNLCPQQIIPLEVLIHSNQIIEVIAEISDPSQKFLECIEKELAQIFAKHLRYERQFILTIAST